VRYIKRYTPEQARRLEIRPDITGWTQVNGRNALSWENRFQMDTKWLRPLTAGRHENPRRTQHRIPAGLEAYSHGW